MKTISYGRKPLKRLIFTSKKRGTFNYTEYVIRLQAERQL